MAHKWMFVAFVAPAFWALVVVIDRWLVTGDNKKFKDESEAAAVAGFFGILPLIFMSVWGLPQMNVKYGCLAVISGVLFIVYTYFYFQAAYRNEDSVLISILMNIPGLLVPLLAAAIMRERLTTIEYVGIAIVVIGSVIACFNGKVVHEKLGRIAWPMAIAIVAFSLSMVADDKVYKEISFYDGVMFFSFGLFLGGIFCYFKKSLMERKFYKPNSMGFVAITIGECANLIALVFSHYAIKVAPSVSYVAAIETTVPAFVMLFGVIIYRVCRIFKIPLEIAYRDVIEIQLVGHTNKALAIVFMGVGIFFAYNLLK